MAINKAILIGNVGADPRINEVQGTMYSSFSLATSERYTDRDGVTREVTEWHTIKANGRLGKVVSAYVRKGSRLYVEGTIRYRKYTDRAGAEKMITEIQAYAIQLLDGKSANEPAVEADNGDMPAEFE